MTDSVIAKLCESIAAGLKKVKKCKIYLEDVPQDMNTPSFLISIYEQIPSSGINGRKKNRVGIDVMYFPKEQQDSKARSECWDIGEDMNLLFSIPDFKMKDRNLEIVDNVLHYTFTVPYRTVLLEESKKMRTISQTTDI